MHVNSDTRTLLSLFLCIITMVQNEAVSYVVHLSAPAFSTDALVYLTCS